METNPSRKMGVLYNIGYEGTDIDIFVSTLRAVGILVLADVRAVALSRKRGFSKNALKARLTAEKIEYVYFSDLGDPKPGREAARAGHYDEFRRIYTRHLESAAAQASLGELGELASRLSTCLMCFEREPNTCHRSIVADRLRTRGFESFNLYGDPPRRNDNYPAKIARCHIGESAPSA
jgi:uncharacterized protein (DUF488 family)